MFAIALTIFALATTALSQSSSLTSSPQSTTAELLLGTLTAGFSGTVISAEPCKTTYALTCSDETICPDPFTLTATQGPSFHEYNFATSVSNSRGQGQASISQSCELQNSAATAICRMWESISFEGRSSSASMKTTLSGEQLAFAQVPITEGVERLMEVTGSCSPAAATAVVSQGGAVPMGVGLGRVVEVVVPVVVIANALL